MHRHIVADKPEEGMVFLYRRTDGAWLLKITKVTPIHVTYVFKMLPNWDWMEEYSISEIADKLSTQDWRVGNTHSREEWADYQKNGLLGEQRIKNIQLLDYYETPNWIV